MDEIPKAISRGLPHNLEAEAAVLGGILINAGAIHPTLEIIRPEDFYRDAHQRIYHAMVTLTERDQPVDLITLSDQLKGAGDIEKIGGAVYLSRLMESISSAANIEHHAGIIRKTAIQRSLIAAAAEISQDSYDEQESVEDLVERAEQKIFNVADTRRRSGLVPVKDIVEEAFDRIKEMAKKTDSLTGTPTGFMDLDDKTSGLHPTDLIIVAGRPGMGKTSFAINICQYAAMKADIPVAVFSLEMSRDQIVSRMFSSRAKVDSSRLRSGRIRDKEWSKLRAAVTEIEGTPIWIDDTPGISVLEIRAKVRRLQTERKLGLIVIDYLQLMGTTGSKRDSREQEVAAITRSLKGMAKEIDVPVIAVSQLSRYVERRGENKRPQLSDLRESGAIEQDADLVIFIYRDEFYNENSEEKGIAEIIIAKARHGPTGTVKVLWSSEYTTFQNLKREY